MKGFICCSGLISDKTVFIKASRIVLIERCEEWQQGDTVRGEYTRIEYAGGRRSVLVQEAPDEVFMLMEDDLRADD